jgi:signal transduction histidine kinase
VVWTLGLDPTLPGILADPDQVRQVITNLLVNATQAMIEAERRDGLVRTWSDANWVGLEVLDTGSGIAPDVLSRIFEPFFTTKAHRQGTGLGLSISHGIIQAHGGEIRGENRPEGGARFTLQLPRDPTRIARTTDA